MLDNLKKSDLFALFDRDELQLVHDIARKSSLMQGEYAFREGEPGDSLIILRIGTLRLTKKTKEGDEQELVILGSGAYVGEMSMFIEGAHRSASGIATERSEILRIPFADLLALLEGHVEMAAKFYRQMAMGLSRRLNYMNEDFTSLKKFLKQRM